MGAIKFLAASDTDARFLVFKRAVLARAEVNGNSDQLDVPGLEQVANTIAGTAIDIEHKPTENFGVLTAGKVENGVLYVDGYFWRDRLIEADVSPQDIEEGKWKLSIEATADEAECSECGNIFRSAREYCNHLRNRVGSEAVRILRGLKAAGGALTKNPAGTDTVFRSDSIYVVASHAEEQEPLPELLDGISIIMHGISTETAVAIQDRRQETQIDEFLALGVSAGIHRREDVSDADKSRAKEKFGTTKFADPANGKFPIHDEEHIRNAWSRINQEPSQKAYSTEEVNTIKRRIVAAWKKVIDPEGPPGANEEEANMPEEHSNEESVAAGDNTATPADENALADLQSQVQELSKQIDAQASQITDLTSTVEERDTTIAERDQAVTDLTEQVTAARTENLRTRLIGSVMEEEEFETQTEMLLGLPEGAIGLMVSAAQRNAAPPTDNGDEDGDDSNDDDDSGDLSVLASDGDGDDGETTLTVGED